MTDKSSYPVETDGKDGPLQPSESGEMAFLDHLEELRYGILTAQRAGATKADVVNCMSKTALAKWLKSTRA